MTQAEGIYRAWIILGLGIVLLTLTVAQIYSGKAFVGYGWWHAPWASRKKEPGFFWGNVIPLGLLAAFAIGLGMTRLVPYYF